MTGDEVTSESSAREPLCPNCRGSLRGNLRQERVVPEGGTAVAVTYCGACGWTLACLPGGPVRHGPLPFQEVAAPADERTPEGRFQIAEIGTHEMLLERGGSYAAIWAAFTGEAELVA